MARRDALLRLHKTLTQRRVELQRRMGMELEDLAKQSTGDTADIAFDTSGEEISSQLAEIESRELVQIDRALKRLKNGTYGLCEICNKRIPVARLDALPYSTVCIGCQRDLEDDPSMIEDRTNLDWERVNDHDPYSSDRKVNLSDLELDMAR
ncbi:TraR/DksA C4-type zinc finger protein [Telmatocola sphagniphila]|uniref:TraR/DksA C4-type zinc finger protein n=1 Tax=Telmatocola sphagniphila TaxID=1123043 RepID=A0A8E6B2W1_9BACT|nr:TraR/DksA C4-type zinc finger protein [Telmatocola sphagniphila]QVL30419.1 TraR/DksA C4-type zinc finger protein [Telmatocola sphagniphila]